MLQGATEKLSIYCRQSIGFAFFLAWCYCSFFSCGLVSNFVVTQSVERIWGFAGLFQAIAAIFVIMLSSRFLLNESKVFGAVTGLISACGTVLIWISFFIPAWYLPVSTAGGMLSGVGMALLALAWGQKMSGRNEEQIEFAVPLSFIVAFGIYFLLLVVKGPLFLVVDTILPLASVWFAFFANQKIPGDIGWKAQRMTHKSSTLKQFTGMVPLFLLNLLLWFQFAYFRILSTPDVAGDRFMYYLLPFSCSFILAIFAFLICIRRSRYMNFTLMYRWALPLMMFSYGLLFLNQTLFDEKMIAYAVNFIAMFGVQLSYWIVAPKYAQRMGITASFLFGGLTVAEGLGVTIGSNFALFLADHATQVIVMNISLLFMSGVILVAMIVGFNPNWFFFHRTAKTFGDINQTELSKAAHNATSSFEQEKINIPGLFEQKALEMQQEFGFTTREKEVAALLLAGYARSYIRDELVISLNTVHAHVRSIYVKCNVHSRREFMDLLENKTS